MRTVSFQSVFEGVIRRHDLDPIGDAITADTARTITGKITKRTRKAWRSWSFLEFSRTEERAFRSIWNATRQFKKVGENGQPDEFFYLGAGFTPGGEFGTNYGYYRVKSSAPSDPPVGTLPTSTTYFEVITPVDTFIALDQTCRRTIGNVLGIYKNNPRLIPTPCWNGNGLKFRPSEKGIDVFCPPGPTVFVHYMLPPSQFTMVPYIAGKNYLKGQRVYFAPPAGDGNCYRALQNNLNHLPTEPAFWVLEPMPEVVANYAEATAYADCLRDTFTNGDQAARLQHAREVAAEAEEYLETEIDNLQAQGQVDYYKLFGRRRYYDAVCYSSQPWSGDFVSTLSDECQGDAFYPPVAVQPGPALIYFPNVNSLKTTTPTLIAELTTGFALKTMAMISTGQQFRLDAGTANPVDPGEGQPVDWALGTHEVKWVEVT